MFADLKYIVTFVSLCYCRDYKYVLRYKLRLTNPSKVSSKKYSSKKTVHCGGFFYA